MPNNSEINSLEGNDSKKKKKDLKISGNKKGAKAKEEKCC